MSYDRMLNNMFLWRNICWRYSCLSVTANKTANACLAVLSVTHGIAFALACLLLECAVTASDRGIHKHSHTTYRDIRGECRLCRLTYHHTQPIQCRIINKTSISFICTYSQYFVFFCSFIFQHQLQ